MNILISVVALFLLSLGVYQQMPKTPKPTPPSPAPKSQVLSVASPSADVNSSVNITIKDKDKENTNNPQPTPNTWRYPGSQEVSSGDTLILKTSDNPDMVTNWYKDKITAQGFGSKSFVTTKTNDKILNKLVAGSSGEEIRVTITKDPGSSSTQIEIVTKSP